MLPESRAKTSAMAGGLSRFSFAVKAEHQASVINRQTIVFIFSDGYDSGEPEDLVTEVLDIKQRCKKLVWINPLLGRQTGEEASYPIERCMNAVIPEVDLYTSAHNLDSLGKLAPAFSLR